MSEIPGPVSEVYSPSDDNSIQDEPVVDHYKTWGYSIGYECDKESGPIPEGGNTAVFRIIPGGLTESVFVTKPQEGATFTVTVLDGEGLCIRAKTDGVVEQILLSRGVEVVVRPGEAYSYANMDGSTDLLLHDVALPAYESGDDIDLTSSLIPEQKPTPREGYAACVAKAGEVNRIIELPHAFFDAMSEL